MYLVRVEHDAFALKQIPSPKFLLVNEDGARSRRKSSASISSARASGRWFLRCSVMGAARAGVNSFTKPVDLESKYGVGDRQPAVAPPLPELPSMYPEAFLAASGVAVWW